MSCCNSACIGDGPVGEGERRPLIVHGVGAALACSVALSSALLFTLLPVPLSNCKIIPSSHQFQIIVSELRATLTVKNVPNLLCLLFIPGDVLLWIGITLSIGVFSPFLHHLWPPTCIGSVLRSEFRHGHVIWVSADDVSRYVFVRC